MMTINFTKIQTKLNVNSDGIFGINSYTALFVKLGAKNEIASELAIAAAIFIPKYEIDATALRFAHFLAQLSHESDGFNAMEEYASGAAYEGRADLGNIQRGDGKRYKGRSPMQGTGRANYRLYGRKMGIDLERHPEVLALPSIGMQFACLYWEVKGLNELADADNIEAITRRINGGQNGLADRKLKLVKTKVLVS